MLTDKRVQRRRAARVFEATTRVFDGAMVRRGGYFLPLLRTCESGPRGVVQLCVLFVFCAVVAQFFLWRQICGPGGLRKYVTREIPGDTEYSL